MIPINKWAGLVTNASQYAIPPGAAVEQVNLQCLVPGQLTVRPGMASVTLPIPSTATTAIVRAFRYQHGTAEHIVYQDSQGRIYSSSVAASAATSGSPPSSPAIVAARPGDRLIALAMTPPSATGGSAVTGYSLQISTDSAATWVAAGSATVTAHTISNLSNGTSYLVRAAATNVYGTGEYSAPYGPVVPAGAVIGPASAPPLVTASSSAANAAAITWQVPTNNGGAPITGYRIQSSANAGSTWDDAATAGNVFSYTLSGLAAGSDYLFRVAAITSYGAGQYSLPSNAVTVTGSLQAPSEVQNLSAVPTDTTLPLTWQAPLSSGSSAVLDYTVTWGSTAISVDGTYTASSLSYTITGLTSGSTVVVRVSARNAAGSGPTVTRQYSLLSAPANTAPSAVTAYSVTPAADGFSVSWSAPSSNGGSAVTGYRTEYAVGTSSSYTLLQSNSSTSATATALTAGQSYSVRTAAINAVGTGPYVTQTVIPTAAPSAPRSFAVTAASPTSAVLTWLAPASVYGSAAMQYTAYATPASGSVIGDYVAGNVLTMTLTGLQPGVAYTFTVTATNAIGSVGAAATASLTMPSTPPVLPTAPRNLLLSPTDGGFAATWDAPADSGSSPITRYEVFYSPPGATLTPLSASTRSASASGLTNGAYTLVRVTAFTSAGSASVSGFVTPSSLPGAVSGLQLQQAIDTDSMAAFWSAPAGGNPVLDYTVTLYRNGTQVAQATSATTAYYFTPATYGAGAYTVSVAACNVKGCGSPTTSNSLSYTVAVAPTAPSVTISSSAGGLVVGTAVASGTISSYDVNYSTNNGASWVDAPAGAVLGNPDVALNGVKFSIPIPYASGAAVSALVRARAKNSLTGPWGVGGVSSVAFGAPVFTPTITSTELTGNRVRILWTAPASTGGPPLTKYTVTYSGDGVTTTEYDAGLSLQYDLTRQTSTTASIVVRAFNSLGSTASSAYTLPAVLPAPGWAVVETNGAIGVQASSSGTVKLRASHPTGIEWQTISFYRWQSSADGVTWTTLADTPTSDDAQGRAYTATSQPSGLRYYRSLASIGGTLSAPSAARTKPTAPGAVRSLAMSAPTRLSPTGMYRTTVSWTAPLYDGGRVVTAYEIQYAYQSDLGQPEVWSDTVEYAVASYGTGNYSRLVEGIGILSGYYLIRVRAAISRDFSDPIRVSSWQYTQQYV